MDFKSALPDPDDTQQAASYIISAIEQDYRYPHACGASLVRAITQMGDAEKLEAYAMESQVAAELVFKLWNSLYLFLIANRTAGEIYDLEVHLSCCVMCNANAFHPGDDTVSKDASIGDLLDHSFHLISQHLQIWKGIQGSLRQHPYQRWPNEESQVIPGDPDLLLSTLFQWYQIFKRPIILTASIVIMDCCGYLLHPSIKNLDITGMMFVEAMKRVADSARVQLKSPSAHTDLENAASNLVYKTFKDHIPPFCHYIDMVLDQPLRACGLMNGREVQALQLCSIVCYLVDNYATAYVLNPEEGTSLDQIKQILVTLGAKILQTCFRKGGYTLPLDLFHHPEIVRQYHSEGVNYVVKATQIAAAIVKFHDYTRCCATTKCTQAPNGNFASVPCLLGCGAVRYCGLECAIADIQVDPADPDSSHMRMCGAMNIIIRSYEQQRIGLMTSWKAWLPGVFDPENQELFLRTKWLIETIKQCLFGGTVSLDDLACLYRWSDTQVQGGGWRDCSFNTDQLKVYEDYLILLCDSASSWGPDSFPEPFLDCGPLQFLSLQLAVDDATTQVRNGLMQVNTEDLGQVQSSKVLHTSTTVKLEPFDVVMTSIEAV